MAKWQKWLLLSGGVIAAVALVVFLTSKTKPTYQGRLLSGWLEIYGAELDSPADQKGADTIRHIGNNALPFLLKWTSYEPPTAGFNNAFRYVLHRISEAMIPAAAERWVSPTYTENRAYTAAIVFELFRDQAHLVITQLTKLMNNPKFPIASRNAVVAMAYVGTDAIPVLSAQLRNPAAPNRYVVGPYVWSETGSRHEC